MLKPFRPIFDAVVVLTARVIALGFIVTALLNVHPAWADEIVLRDGERITGQIVKKDGQTVTVRSKGFGTVTLKWDDVEAINTDQPLNVVLTDNVTVKSNIRTLDGHFQINAPGGTQNMAPTDIIALRDETEEKLYERFLDPGPLDLWTITGSFNLAGTKGNAKTSTVTTPVNFLRVSSTSRTTAYFNSIISSALVSGVNSQTARAVRGGWGYSRNLSKKFFVNSFNDYEYDKFQSLDLRTVFGGGLGYQLWTGETGRASLVAGGDWNRARFSPASSPYFVRNSAEAYWGDDLNYKLGTRTSLVQGLRMFNDLSNTGEYRVNFDLNVVTGVTKWLNWNVSLSDRNLSAPAPGRKSNDLLYTTGLGFTFAR